MILEIIKQGKIKSKDLEELTKLKGSQVRAKIRKLRLSGAPILSDNEGYYYANNRSELQHTINTFFSRGNKMFEAARKLDSIFPKEEIPKNENQINIFEE